ncbi:MBL fold metallo-hydrolase [Novosphingopyxis sp.]|uniref:MBL fold metallo-hydrolase n=1 Tax=Novosphingopyxis sp. TaxID=2709690 RepID=UPI003B590BDD
MRDLPSLITSRRAVLGMSAAGMLGFATRSFSATRAFTVPQVDSLSLQVIVDAATFGPFLENLDLPGMKVIRAGNGGPVNAPRMLPQTLVGEFGLSILCDSNIGYQRRRVVVDFGYSKEALSTNLRLLGIDPVTIDAAVLSHGHLDHYGGFPGLFGPVLLEDAARGKIRVPLTVGGEETFCERVALIGNPPPVMGALDRLALSRAGFDVIIRPEPAVIADHAFTTGIIPMNGFERAAIPTRMRPGTGCDRTALNPAKQAAAELPDDAEHELATCYAVKGLGLIVIASCSHRGVINSVRRAQAISGIEKVYAVVGGFHLVRPRTEAEARQTVAEFAVIDPTYIVPMHCTGDVFVMEALRIMPEKVIRSYVGSKFMFSEAFQ